MSIFQLPAFSTTVMTRYSLDPITQPIKLNRLLTARRIAFSQELVANVDVRIRAEIFPGAVIDVIPIDYPLSHEQTMKLWLRTLPSSVGFLLGESRACKQSECCSKI